MYWNGIWFKTWETEGEWKTEGCVEFKFSYMYIYNWSLKSIVKGPEGDFQVLELSLVQFAVTNSCIALSLEVCPDRRQTETGNEGKFTSFPSTDTGLFIWHLIMFPECLKHLLKDWGKARSTDHSYAEICKRYQKQPLWHWRKEMKDGTH